MNRPTQLHQEGLEDIHNGSLETVIFQMHNKTKKKQWINPPVNITLHVDYADMAPFDLWRCVRHGWYNKWAIINERNVKFLITRPDWVLMMLSMMMAMLTKIQTLNQSLALRSKQKRHQCKSFHCTTFINKNIWIPDKPQKMREKLRNISIVNVTLMSSEQWKMFEEAQV